MSKKQASQVFDSRDRCMHAISFCAELAALGQPRHAWSYFVKCGLNDPRWYAGLESVAPRAEESQEELDPELESLRTARLDALVAMGKEALEQAEHDSSAFVLRYREAHRDGNGADPTVRRLCEIIERGSRAMADLRRHAELAMLGPKNEKLEKKN